MDERARLVGRALFGILSAQSLKKHAAQDVRFLAKCGRTPAWVKKVAKDSGIFAHLCKTAGCESPTLGQAGSWLHLQHWRSRAADQLTSEWMQTQASSAGERG